MKRKFTHDSLGIRLTQDIFLLMLPFYVIILVTLAVLNQNVKKELLATYENELDVYTAQLDDRISGLDNRLMEAGSLKAYEDFSSLTQYRYWKELKNIRLQNSIADFVYSEIDGQNTEDGEPVFLESVNEESLSYSQIAGLERLLKEDVSEESSYYRMVWVGDSCYLWRQMLYPGCRIGCLCSVDTLLENLDSGEGTVLYMEKPDTGESSLADASGQTEGESAGEQEETSAADFANNYYTVTAESESYEFRLVRLLPKALIDSAYPFLGRILITLGLLSILLVPFFLLRIRALVIRPLGKLEKAMHQIEEQDFTYQMETAEKSREFRYIDQAFNRMAEKINTLTVQVYEKEIERLQIEEDNLRLQINPHMLLNSFNMICSLACSRNYDLIQKFSRYLMRYFQYALKRNEPYVSLGQEMAFVENFVEIQKIRFQDMFTCIYVVDDALLDYRIPPLLIQNFVENAIKYGITGEGDTEVIIVAMRDEDSLRISVCDTGGGMDEETLAQIRQGKTIERDGRSHIGLWNCRRRLAYCYGERAQFSVTSQKGGGTQVWMRLPLTDENAEGFFPDAALPGADAGSKGGSKG